MPPYNPDDPNLIVHRSDKFVRVVQYDDNGNKLSDEVMDAREFFDRMNPLPEDFTDDPEDFLE